MSFHYTHRHTISSRNKKYAVSNIYPIVDSEGRHPRVLGPVFLQLKDALAPFWTRPQHLSYLAWARVRTAIGPKRLARYSQPAHK